MRSGPGGSADLQAAVWDRYQEGLKEDQQARTRYPTATDLEGAKNKLTAEIKAGRVVWSADPLVQLNATLELMVIIDVRRRFGRGRWR
jgi:hypothetical protein